MRLTETGRGWTFLTDPGESAGVLADVFWPTRDEAVNAYWSAVEDVLGMPDVEANPLALEMLERYRREMN